MAGEALANAFPGGGAPSPVGTITPGHSPRAPLGNPIEADDDIPTIQGASNNAGVDSNVAGEI
jgi:hypothetical protein